MSLDGGFRGYFRVFFTMFHWKEARIKKYLV